MLFPPLEIIDCIIGRPTAELKAILWGRINWEENCMSLNLKEEPSFGTYCITGDIHMGKLLI
jgi:hypothetical protein